MARTLLSAAFDSGLRLGIVLNDTGHWVLEERPKETTEALVNFSNAAERHTVEGRASRPSCRAGAPALH